MIKIIQGLKIDLPDDTTLVKCIYDPNIQDIQYYKNCVVIRGNGLRYFNTIAEKVLNPRDELISCDYKIQKQQVTVGGLCIESYSCYPTKITVVNVDMSAPITHEESDGSLMVAVPHGTTESELMIYMRDKLTYYAITAGTNKRVGNLLLYDSSDVSNRDYDSTNIFDPDSYKFPVIDEGLVTRAFKKYLEKTFPEMSVIIFGDEQYSRTGSYVEYTLMSFSNWRRPFIETETRDTIISEIRFKVDVIARDSREFMRILHKVRANELLTNNGKLWVEDTSGNKWKCAMDWSSPMYDHSPGSARGNLGKNAGNNFYLECSIRNVNVPYSTTSYSEIEDIELIFKFITKII